MVLRVCCLSTPLPYLLSYHLSCDRGGCGADPANSITPDHRDYITAVEALMTAAVQIIVCS